MGSFGAPPAYDGVWETGLTFVTTTSRLLICPTAVSGNARSVGATVIGKIAVPDMEMAKFSPSMPIVVLLEWGPADAGSKVYVNSQLLPAARGTPAQFWLPPKLVGSFGAPPAKFGVCVVALTFVTVTPMDVESPTNVSGNDSDGGATVKSPGAACAGRPEGAAIPMAADNTAAARAAPRRCRREVLTAEL